MTALARTILFLSAYVPAFLLLAWRAHATNPQLTVGLLTGSAAILVMTLRLMRELRRGTSLRAEVITADSRSLDIGGFLLGYVLPFMVADYQDISSVVTMGAIFLILGVITVRGHLTHLNPLLLILGMTVWRLKVEFADQPRSKATKPDAASVVSALVISDDLDIDTGSVLWITKTTGPVWFAAKEDPLG